MYSPRIKPELVKRLYQLKQSRNKKKPMTFYVNDAIQKYLDRLDQKGRSEGQY